MGSKAKLLDRQRQKKARQAARSRAKQLASKQFSTLLETCRNKEPDELQKLLLAFAKRGKYEQQLVDQYRGITKKRPKRVRKPKAKKQTWLDRMALSSSAKPYQGGAPGSGKKR